MIRLPEMLARLLAGEPASEAESEALLLALAERETAPALAGALLVALRAKGVTSAELRGFASGMRRLSRRPALDVEGAIDIVGTGGDGSSTFNLSTGAALLVAAMGVPVIKHGNRAVSSQSGSADVLEALGLPIPLDDAALARCLAETSFTFLFAPHHHPAMQQIGAVRRALGVRTVFNLLGPLTNPAAPPYALIGAYDLEAAELIAEALSGMRITRAFVVHGEPGWDEASPAGAFVLFDVRPGAVARSERDPLAVGIARAAPEALRGGDARHNAAALREALSGDGRGPHADALVLNAGLALEVRGVVASWDEGIALARAAIERRDAARCLERLAAFGAGR